MIHTNITRNCVVDVLFHLEAVFLRRGEFYWDADDVVTFLKIVIIDKINWHKFWFFISQHSYIMAKREDNNNKKWEENLRELFQENPAVKWTKNPCPHATSSNTVEGGDWGEDTNKLTFSRTSNSRLRLSWTHSDKLVCFSSRLNIFSCTTISLSNTW